MHQRALGKTHQIHQRPPKPQPVQQARSQTGTSSFWKNGWWVSARSDATTLLAVCTYLACTSGIHPQQTFSELHIHCFTRCMYMNLIDVALSHGQPRRLQALLFTTYQVNVSQPKTQIACFGYKLAQVLITSCPCSCSHHWQLATTDAQPHLTAI